MADGIEKRFDEIDFDFDKKYVIILKESPIFL